jgi:hypothetical protein
MRARRRTLRIDYPDPADFLNLLLDGHSIQANGNVNRDFFSARMGCESYQPVYGIDLAALCIRRG